MVYVTCPGCSEDFHKNVNSANKTACRNCGRSYTINIGIIASVGKTPEAKRLAEGPIEYTDINSNRLRTVIRKIKPPTTTNGSSKPWDNIANLKGVIYLPGHEREAITLFIDLNEDFVRECLNAESTYTPLRHHFSEVMYDILLEQWHWLGYAQT